MVGTISVYTLGLDLDLNCSHIWEDLEKPPPSDKARPLYDLQFPPLYFVIIYNPNK